MTSHEGQRTWARWLVTENGKRVGQRRFGRSKIADMIAHTLM